MDDSHFQSRPPARPIRSTPAASLEAPARGRPARPIRFTPSRTDPIAPPPLAHGGHAERSSLAARLGVWTLVVVGWAVFVAWWVIVLQRESVRSFGVALGLLGATIATAAVGMMLWTRHNIRIARNGKRGMSSLYIPMAWERDTLGRSLELPAQDIARSASEVRIVLRDGLKTYVIAEEEEL